MPHHIKKYLKAAIACVALWLAYPVHAINVTDVASGTTTGQMQAVLQGTGVTISNLTITPVAGCTVNQGVGVFTNGTTPVGAGPVLGEPTGVVVSNSSFATGNRVDSSNNAANVTNGLCGGAVSDPDMVAIEAGTANGEYAAIEFDVVPQSTILAIPFQFGSDEFPEYVCSNFNDIVGIFVSGPGITGPFSGALQAENYAKTAAGDLSSINWVNTGIVGQNGNIGNCGSLTNAAFYSDNSNGNTTGGNATVATTNANLEMDGFTNTLFQPITVVPGQTYHVKIAVADSADRLYDSTAFIHPIFSTGTFSGFDYGDAPDSYGTLTSNGGPNHGIDNTIFMGAGAPDNEITGIPSVNADGDDLDNTDDEDGVSSFPVLLSNATSYSVDVNVTNNSGSTARLVGWIDFNGNGTFESAEGTQTDVANGTTGATVALNWPSLSGLVAGDTYARIRFSSDLGLSIFTTGSSMSDGEVEDYTLPISGITFTKYVSTDPACSDTLQTLNVSIGTSIYYCYSVTNPNVSAFTISATTDNQGHDISALEGAYAAGASNNVIIGPLVAGGAQLPAGTTIVNDASVTADIGGSSIAVNGSASLTVSAALPASGIKRLYFETVAPGGNLTRDPTDSITQDTSANIAKNGGTLTLNQGTPFTAASPFTITGGTDVIVQLRIRRRANRASSVRVELFNGNGGAAIGGPVTSSITAARNVWQTLTMPAIVIPADVTLGANDYIQLVITNISTGNGVRNIQVRNLEDVGGGVIDKSQIQLESNTVINVDNIDAFSAPYPATTKFSSYEPGTGDTVYIRATVSDPFGWDDITGANLTITDSAPTVVVNNAAMTSEPAPAGTIRVFEYPYVIPAAPEGFWNLSVTADEGYENEVSHTSQATMIVGLPDITISKNSTVLSDPINTDNYKAIPGATVEYTITVDNSGFGYVDLDTFVLDDPVPAGATFYFGSPLNPIDFTDGTTPSGLSFTFIDLASTIDDIEFYNNGGADLVTPSVDANGNDITSPPIDLIKLLPKGEFNGGDTTPANNPSMEFKFRVKVD